MPLSLLSCISFLLLFLSAPTIAAETDLASAPLNTELAARVKPNIYFILDDSGSMQSSYLGNEAGNINFENTIGYRSSLCNKIYYNPQTNYLPPVDASGVEFPSQNFNSAMYDGYKSNAVKIDLASNFMAWRSSETNPALPVSTSDISYSSDCFKSFDDCTLPGSNDLPNNAEAAYYFTYKGSQRDKLGMNSSEDQCKDVLYDSSNAGSRNWTKIIVSATSGPGGKDERQNFANWFSYYRTRILTMKTAVGRAFRDFDQHFRVGFSVISYKGVDSNDAGFLKIADFDGPYKTNFYSKIYGINPEASTPLRAALSKAGRIYAGQLLSAENDPVQYSCQRNYTLLSTDGYWNADMEDATYGPFKIDGKTQVGNQDNTLDRPMYDGSGNAAGSIAPARVGRIIISTTRSSSRLRYAEINEIKINGQVVTTTSAYVSNTSNPAEDASWLAAVTAQAIKLGGYRAASIDNTVFITAPASAGELVADIVVTGRGSLTFQSMPFENVPASDRTLNTLADVAAYFYQTDLRTAALGNCRGEKNVCINNVPTKDGKGGFQHMQTYTLGLGGNGTLAYQENYADAPTGDFRDIKTGLRNWPDPVYLNGPERLDDLWHAAVNGGGKYFNAKNPESLTRALSETLNTIRANTGAAAAAATSSQEPVEGDNALFVTRYRSIFWDGELEARAIELADGTVSSAQKWSAQTLLDRRAAANTDTRKIYTYGSNNNNLLKNFLWSELNATERAYFDNEKQVNYLRGQQQHEDRPENTERLFRRRDHVLGPLINAQPLFVARPAFAYADENYAAFRDEQQIRRKGMVYAPANDGMLHAFNAESGEEEWAFIPSAVLPGMKRFADPVFTQNFRYLLDGTPVAADICPSAPQASCDKTQWRTVLIGGLAGGGRQYYALDITNPDIPKLLWQFGTQQDNDLGFAYGKPIVTKRRNGRWVALFTSGYNNINPGTGKSFLFVVDAATGVLLDKIGTGSGSETSPGGLAQINAWVDTPVDNTVTRLYGGDLLGNVWRFDIDDILPPAGKEALLLATVAFGGKAQPITTRPELSEIQTAGRLIPVVSVATGKYLGLSDVSDSSTQSIYTFKDELGSTGLGDLRTNRSMVKQTMTQSTDGNTRTISEETVDWLLKAGWFIDLNADSSAPGERVTIDPDQQLGILRVVANLPGSTACNIGGASWIYTFDYRNGKYLPLAKDKAVGNKLPATALIAGARTVKWQGRMLTILTDEAGSIVTNEAPLPSGSSPTVKRVSWRELDDQ